MKFILIFSLLLQLYQLLHLSSVRNYNGEEGTLIVLCCFKFSLRYCSLAQYHLALWIVTLLGVELTRYIVSFYLLCWINESDENFSKATVFYIS